MKSELIELGSVSFPDNTGERVYMLPFFQREGLPANLSRWQPTVDAMLVGIHTEEPIYLMIDQGRVEAGKSQRRPGAHIDGYWNPEKNGHGGTGGGGHGSHRPGKSGAWNTATFAEPEAILLASDLCASRALVGDFDGPIGEGGDCSRLNLSALESVSLRPHRAYIGNVTMIHESLPVERDCQRTLVRLNLPGVNL
jgi:hypothetical protein